MGRSSFSLFKETTQGPDLLAPPVVQEELRSLDVLSPIGQGLAVQGAVELRRTEDPAGRESARRASLREVFGKDPDVSYGPSCKSGPLGGDAQLVAMAVTGQLGGCIFFIDPMDSHPHSADIECLVRQGNVHNILMMNNPCTAHVSMNTFRIALKMGRMEMIPSFFFDMESPSVEAYKQRQNAVLQNAISRRASIVVQNVTTVLVPTRENKVNLAMKRANDKRVSFVMDGKIPTFDEEDDEESYEDDGQQRESFLPKSGQKTKFNIFNMFGMCCEA